MRVDNRANQSVEVNEEDGETVFLRLSDVDGNRADNIDPLVCMTYEKTCCRYRIIVMSFIFICCDSWKMGWIAIAGCSGLTSPGQYIITSPLAGRTTGTSISGS